MQATRIKKLSIRSRRYVLEKPAFDKRDAVEIKRYSFMIDAWKMESARAEMYMKHGAEELAHCFSA